MNKIKTESTEIGNTIGHGSSTLEDYEGYIDKEVGDLIEGKIETIKHEYISAYAQSKIDTLNKQLLELTMENAELKDMVLDNGGEYAETDGYEVGSPSDYEEDKQLSFNFGRRAEDEVREQFNRECD